MKFHPTSIHGAYLLELEERRDDRGFFARFFCEEEFRARGLETNFLQLNNSLSHSKGTLRGMHYQLPPAADAKVVRVMRGALYDVILDLRPDSPSFHQWFGAELTDQNRRAIYVPKGCAHGFITTADETEVLYMVSATHTPDCERGLRYNDPAFTIQWPIAPTILSDKDRNWQDFNEQFHGIARMRGLL